MGVPVGAGPGDDNRPNRVRFVGPADQTLKYLAVIHAYIFGGGSPVLKTL
ncbi:Uncharacterised protein [Mycobacteroides abscessus subsp. abscessus]|nr:Uncharacterised protein [Mycobacteroides abscessus subsp. abscessus]